jgi:hypothetical protein
MAPVTLRAIRGGVDMRNSLHHVHLFEVDVESLPEGLRSYFE